MLDCSAGQEWFFDESFYQFNRLPFSLNVLVKCENACNVEALFHDTKRVRVHLKTIYGIHLWRLHALKASREQIVWVPFLPLWRDYYRTLSQTAIKHRTPKHMCHAQIQPKRRSRIFVGTSPQCGSFGYFRFCFCYSWFVYGN